MSDKTPDFVSQTEVAHWLGVTRQTVINLEEHGMPVEREEGKYPRYPVPDVIQWYVKYKQGGVRSYDQLRARHEAAKAELAEIKVAKERGDLVTAQEFERVLGGCLDQLRSKIISRPGAWAARVIGIETPNEGQAAVKEMMSDLLDLLRAYEPSAESDSDSQGSPAADS
jgi:Phage DNA packaging protein, Nu1 subunit of terminase